MQNLCDFDGSFFDRDYFENGPGSGKGWLSNYRWMPRRSFREAFAYIDTLGLGDDSYVLDIGCAKGFIVRALRELDIRADGCDISEYALSFAPSGCWNCSDKSSWSIHSKHGYTHIVVKDVLEHFTVPFLRTMLLNFSVIAKKMMCIIPMGDNGKYRIPEYHTEISHLIAENESWWLSEFSKAGWHVTLDTPHIKGLKDNWQSSANGIGNHVFVLENN